MANDMTDEQNILLGNDKIMDFRCLAQSLSAKIIVIMGWRLDDFWNATPMEIATLFENEMSNAAPLDRQTLDALIQNEQSHP